MKLKFSINNCLAERILVLDGGLGTMLGGYPAPTDALVLSEPEVIARVHEAYLTAGADIVSTATFNANAISLSDYSLAEKVYEINLAAARVARAEADKFTLRNPSKPRFVAGSMGPTNRTTRDVGFEAMADAYLTQARGLMDGGVDVLLIETVFDTLNARAALVAIARLNEERSAKFPSRGGVADGTSDGVVLADCKIPVMLSGTIASDDGRNLSGQTIEAFCNSLKHNDLLSIGLNCAFGARQMRPFVERLAQVAQCRVSCHPNAGLPNVEGGYDETPEMFAAEVEQYLKKRLVNIIGGCCGTTPEHIRLVAQLAGKYQPRPLPEPQKELVLSGTETLRVDGFVKVGERANVAGSAKFARLIRDENWDEAIAVAREQIAAGAQIMDVCMDDGMVDGVGAMRRFLELAAVDPVLARVPVMIDSSDWAVLVAGLQSAVGKGVVNSISLKNGEAEFLQRAREVQRYGAAVVVMLFDESGQADTFERKVEVAERAYKLLTLNGFPAEDIIFDPNVLMIASGIASHNNYAVDFIRATRWIKQNLLYARVSAGVSNLSFSFRGNNPMREAIHAVFLHHATAAGLDMGIINSSTALDYNELQPSLRELVEDLVLNRRGDAAERLAVFAAENATETPLRVKEGWQSKTDGVVDRISISDAVKKQTTAPPTGIKVLLATVRGDIHDIGKKIVGSVLTSAGHTAIDLGVGVEASKIADEAERNSVNVIGLSGLITPSLDEMTAIARLLEQRGSKIPIIIGGATTSRLHTALKIAPEYSGVVVHARDTADGLRIVNSLTGAESDNFVAQVKAEQAEERKKYAAKKSAQNIVPLAVAQKNAYVKPTSEIVVPLYTGRIVFSDFPIAAVEPYINWTMFFAAWEARGRVEKEQLKADALELLEEIRLGKLLRLEGVAGVFPARRGEGEAVDTIIISAPNGDEISLPQPRNREAGRAVNSSVADYVTAAGGDYIGAFALTGGVGLRELGEVFARQGNDYKAVMAKFLADRLTEAFAEAVHEHIRREVWGYQSSEIDPSDAIHGRYRGRRYAFGYPAMPDHAQKRDVFRLLGVEQTTSMRLTDNNMITPGEALCGLVVADQGAEYFNV